MKAKTIRDKAVVFDFDDTLIISKALTHLYRDGKYIKSMTPDEYHFYKKLPNEEFDFQEFDSPKKIKAEQGPCWKLLKSLDISKKYPLYILTARKPSAQIPIYNYLINNNIDSIPLENIYCCGAENIDASEIPLRKEFFMLKYIKPFHNRIDFYDDNYLNVLQLSKITGIRAIRV